MFVALINWKKLLEKIMIAQVIKKYRVQYEKKNVE